MGVTDVMHLLLASSAGYVIDESRKVAVAYLIPAELPEFKSFAVVWITEEMSSGVVITTGIS